MRGMYSPLFVSALKGKENEATINCTKMKKNKSPEKADKADFPDVKKIEKTIQTENRKKIIEVPDHGTSDKPYTPPLTEIPERKEEDEVEKPDEE